MNNNKNQHNIRQYSDTNFRVAVADPETGEELQHYFRTLSAAQTWRDAMLSLRQAALLPGAHKLRKSANAVQGFPVGICPCVDTRTNKDGTTRTHHFVRSTINLNNGKRKTHNAKYGDNRTLEEALAIVMEKRTAFVRANPDLFT